MEGSLEGSHGDRVRLEDGRGHRGGLHHYPGLNSPDQHSEQIIKQILSGAATLVGGLAAMRNALSDAHGRGKRSVGPAPRHAKLAVNAGFAIAGFLIDTHVEKPPVSS